MFCRSPRWLALALVGAVGFVVAIGPAAAQQETNVTVQASVEIPTELSMTLCDTTADFGEGLTYLGDAPSGTDDTITATDPGDPGQGQGVFYIWTPTCTSGSFMHVESNISWQATICASPTTGSSTSITVENADLRVSSVQFTTYDTARTTTNQVRLCDNPSTVRPMEEPGTFDFTYYLYLQVDRTDDEGTFNSVTTWTVTP